jgi:transglutaminase-like putative cysteine protease
MMFTISHVTRYVYKEPVFLEPHVIRLRPRSDVTQQLTSFELTFSPQPTGRSEYLDLDGNCVTQVWFEELTAELQIKARSAVRTLRSNPFDFFFDKAQISTLGYHPELFPFFDRTRKATGVSKSVEALSRTIADETKGDVMKFLLSLNERLAKQISHVSRATGLPHSSDLTLAEGKGACRDVAVLFIDCCRIFGLPTRFVSGYSEGAHNEKEHELHAWAEVCLPGGGWRGFDPSSGLCVADRHVALAASYAPIGAAPVTGTIRSDSAVSELYTEIVISHV